MGQLHFKSNSIRDKLDDETHQDYLIYLNGRLRIEEASNTNNYLTLITLKEKVNQVQLELQ